MVRTQIYLTEYQREKLAVIAKSSGKKQSEIIREAIERFIGESGSSHRESVIHEAAGIWKNRDDLPDFKSIRAEWDREQP
jgi:hypothetical protein